MYRITVLRSDVVVSHALTGTVHAGVRAISQLYYDCTRQYTETSMIARFLLTIIQGHINKITASVTEAQSNI